MVAGERNKEIMGGIVEIGALVEPNMGNIYAIFFSHATLHFSIYWQHTSRTLRTSSI
jgi:hypothetical protein